MTDFLTKTLHFDFNAGIISPSFQLNAQSSHVSQVENVFHFLINVMVSMTVGTIQMKPIVQVNSKNIMKECNLQSFKQVSFLIQILSLSLNNGFINDQMCQYRSRLHCT